MLYHEMHVGMSMDNPLANWPYLRNVKAAKLDKIHLV